jgi:hypothetical protein
VPVFVEDTIMYPKIGAVKEYLQKIAIEITSKDNKIAQIFEPVSAFDIEIECCPV